MGHDLALWTCYFMLVFVDDLIHFCDYGSHDRWFYLVDVVDDYAIDIIF